MYEFRGSTLLEAVQQAVGRSDLQLSHKMLVKAGFAEPDIYDFQPSDFAGYTHQNTEDEDSAIDDHVSFATFAFSG